MARSLVYSVERLESGKAGCTWYADVWSATVASDSRYPASTATRIFGRVTVLIMEYSLDGITLINGDCMDYLRSLPDNAFQVAVVDPPYGDGNFQNPPHQAMNRDGGGGWFNRYKRPMEQIRGEVRQVQDTQANFARSRADSGGTAAIYPHAH